MMKLESLKTKILLIPIYSIKMMNLILMGTIITKKKKLNPKKKKKKKKKKQIKPKDNLSVQDFGLPPSSFSSDETDDDIENI
jgi:hypothetical protein